jgi:predicted porin
VYKFKKKRLAIFLNALFISSGINALDLNFYGVGHVSADVVDDGKDKSVYAASNSSRLGFNGSNHIADRLTVLFQFETGLDPTSQGTNDGNGSSAIHTSQIFTKGRPSFVGLQASFGKLLIGHIETADQWINDYNLFADQVGDTGNLWAGSGLPGRSDNVFYYEAPAINGFKGAATFMPAEGTTDGTSMLFKGDYAKESLTLGAAYISIGEGNFGGGEKHTAVALTGSYQTDKFTMGGGVQAQTDAGGMANNNIMNISLGGSIKVNDKSKVKAHYVNLNTDTANSNASLFSLGFDYACDSSTLVYAAFAWVNNDDNSKMVANGKGHGDSVVNSQVAGESSTAISIGLVSKFNVSLLK